MEYIKKEQILLDEELCGYPIRENEIGKATIKFRENIKLAHFVADNLYAPVGSMLTNEDVIQDAYLGLWKACLRFDDSRNNEFSTYAIPIIRNQILMSFRDNVPIKTPLYFNKIKNAINKHEFTLPLTEEEIDIIARECKLSKKQLSEYSDVKIYSLHTPIEKVDKSDITYENTIPDNTSFESEFTEEEIEEIIDKILSYVKPQYRDFIEDYLYSKMEGAKTNQKELGAKYNLSRSYASRIINLVVKTFKVHKKQILKLFGI